MANLRHIAIMVTDPKATAEFFQAAFGMVHVADHPLGYQLSDGVINVTLLIKEFDHEVLGIDHFGVMVDDLDAAIGKALAAGAEIIGQRHADDPVALEVKFRGPDGLVFDLSRKGWPVAGKDERSNEAD
jgi:lactoylglutathione lyase